jgi:hypothetical protein
MSFVKIQFDPLERHPLRGNGGPALLGDQKHLVMGIWSLGRCPRGTCTQLTLRPIDLDNSASMRGRPRSSDRGLVEDWLETDVASLPRPRPKLADIRFQHLTAALTTELPNLKKTMQSVELEITRPHFGGVRYWYRCPRCQARRRKLYTYYDFLDRSPRPYACRVCLNLFYEVQYRKSAGAIQGRALRAYVKALKKPSLPRSARSIRSLCNHMRVLSCVRGIPELAHVAQDFEEILDWEAQVLNEDRPT